jgi:large-conductance mechanosensitive channel
MNPESVDVTAGLGGFLAFFLLAVALYFLMRNMNTRLRRMSYREEQEAKAAGEKPLDDRPDSDGPEGGRRNGPALG